MRSISAKDYARALIGVSHGRSGDDATAIVANFMELVKKNHDWPRRDEIFKAVVEEERRSAGRNSYVVESARHLPAHLSEIILKALETTEKDVEHKVNPELIAGVRITRNTDEQLDMSLSHIMKKVFTS